MKGCNATPVNFSYSSVATYRRARALPLPLWRYWETMMLFSYGHGTATREDIVNHLNDSQIELLVDVRSFPGSRRVPHVGKEKMREWLPAAGIEYLWLGQALGGFRKAEWRSGLDPVWRHPSFRNYAGYMRSDDFVLGIDSLIKLSQECRVAYMCSESVWWKCHRRMISDFLTVARGIEVTHIMHNGRNTVHAPTQGNRLRDDGLLVYDVKED